MQETEHYKFKKPGPEDFYNVEDQNTNFDKVDAALAGLITVGGAEPTGAGIWFDTSGHKPMSGTVVALKLGKAGADGDVLAEIGGAKFPVENATAGETPQGDSYNFEIV